jgi:hypothetical protein
MKVIVLNLFTDCKETYLETVKNLQTPWMKEVGKIFEEATGRKTCVIP